MIELDLKDDIELDLASHTTIKGYRKDCLYCQATGIGSVFLEDTRPYILYSVYCVRREEQTILCVIP